jgi:protein gp37
MAKNSQIEWTHHTFNPWWGCAKVSPACKNCYAESWAKRVGEKVWGRDSERRFFGDAHWAHPLAWNAEAQKEGTRRRVFCASMADVFEKRVILNPHRERLWKLIEATPALDWLLLTKRPQNIASMVPWGKVWPKNVWLGTTVENQQYADQRLPHLLKHDAQVRFLSCEPLLGPVDLSQWTSKSQKRSIDWVIAGGESGPSARPSHPDWFTGLRDFCIAKKIAFHFKQWGHWIPVEMNGAGFGSAKSTELQGGRVIKMLAVGKKMAGRKLDGLTYDQFPLDKLAM